ncbi:hypothetical protein ACE1AT_12635 [Pelatocladus sp. BLCC-F211]|uniref:hypothetical protein n=1 Tax=Pelatocladus sp. BLCC-F211 TaxID=3342752 RepID=UPI0035B98AD4
MHKNLSAGIKVRKINGTMLLNSVGEVTKTWTSPGGIECVWVKYPEWSVPILEFAHWLEPVTEVQNTPIQLTLF